MEKRLKTSVIATVCIVAACFVSDHVFHTRYLGETCFQPFPHILLLIGLFCDLYFWYHTRREKANENLFERRANSVLFDRLLVFVMICLGGATIGLILNYIQGVFM